MKTAYITCLDDNDRKRTLVGIKEGQTNIVHNICFYKSDPAEIFYNYFNCFIDSARLLLKKENELEIYEYSLGRLSQKEMGMHLVRAMNSPKFLEEEISGYAWL